MSGKVLGDYAGQTGKVLDAFNSQDAHIGTIMLVSLPPMLQFGDKSWAGQKGLIPIVIVKEALRRGKRGIFWQPPGNVGLWDPTTIVEEV